MNGRPPVVILCGGRGTRLQEHTRAIPKPLVEIGGMPIVWHVVRLYAAQGFRRFLLATGYRGEMIERFAAAHQWPDGVSVQCLDTGLDTPTGGRIKLLAPRLADDGLFCATYSDGLADVDLDALLRFHHEHGALASMTVVRPQMQFGVAQLEPDGRVSGFARSPPPSTGSTAASSASTRACSTTCSPTACSSARRSSVSPPTINCARGAIVASGSAWTLTRTRSPSMTCGTAEHAPWRVWREGERERRAPELAAAVDS